MFQAFVKSVGIYPTGSRVRLASGRLAAVVEQHAKALTSAKVRAFFSTKSNLRIVPVMINLASPDRKKKIVSREDSVPWNFPDLDELWLGQLQ